MKTVLRIGCVLAGILFVTLGLRWLVDPTASAVALGFVLSDGIGRTSQIADFAAFFLVIGVCILLGLVTRQRLWFYPPALALAVAAIGRLLAWSLHAGAFTGAFIAVEFVVAALVLAAASWLPERNEP